MVSKAALKSMKLKLRATLCSLAFSITWRGTKMESTVPVFAYSRIRILIGFCIILSCIRFRMTLEKMLPEIERSALALNRGMAKRIQRN